MMGSLASRSSSWTLKQLKITPASSCALCWTRWKLSDATLTWRNTRSSQSSSEVKGWEMHVVLLSWILVMTKELYDICLKGRLYVEDGNLKWKPYSSMILLIRIVFIRFPYVFFQNIQVRFSKPLFLLRCCYCAVTVTRNAHCDIISWYCGAALDGGEFVYDLFAFQHLVALTWMRNRYAGPVR